MGRLQKALERKPEFERRHIGPDENQIQSMLKSLGYETLDALTDVAVPKSIHLGRTLALDGALTEHEALDKLRRLARRNKIYRTFIGMGYYNCLIPPVIQRNILENPGWYTQYTPYQAEIAQGRLEALLNFQTLITDLTGLPVANASLLDEGTAAAEAMALSFASRGRNTSKIFFIAKDCHPQTIAVVQTRAEPLGVEVVVGDLTKFSAEQAPFGLLLQYPNTYGDIIDLESTITKARAAGTIVTMASDLLALTVLKSPGELGADIAVGSAQRFGVPLGFGGPHAAFFATRDEHKRKLPGRIIGLSKDVSGEPAMRMALQTREQHIRREKATSNICTSQVLLAIMTSMYAVYHGPEGLTNIALRTHGMTAALALGLKNLGYKVKNQSFFDTVSVEVGADKLAPILRDADTRGINLRKIDEITLGVSLDETTRSTDVEDLLQVFGQGRSLGISIDKLLDQVEEALPSQLRRTSLFLQHPVFTSHHSETKMLRYIRLLESRDLSLTRSMIPLGSCTMKLNATAELMPVTWPEFGSIHPFAPISQAEGYLEMFNMLETYLAECTGFHGVSLQPNSGAQGELAGLLVIRKYHQARSQGHRDVCLIPKSAHGTNPASAAMAGMRIVAIECDNAGNIDVADLKAKAAEHAANLSALMITYPSTHGVFEATIQEICEVIHGHGGQVYMDGANMNAQVGLCRPGDFGPDVCHLNLHKTFCIPHGGGGPGVGPIAVHKHLTPFLPSHPINKTGGDQGTGPISAAGWGSASILPISLMYIWMMGARGLVHATQVAILNANYMAQRLDPHFPVLYKGNADLVAHECIIDLRPLKAKAGIEVEDVAKRLMDYGFHAPTVSWPVAGTLMIEPTESESKEELDRYCEAMISIRREIREIEEGRADKENNLLKHAPHTAATVLKSEWDRPYSREQAAYPAPWLKGTKFWPSVSRVDSAYGDRNLVCTCGPLEDYV